MTERLIAVIEALDRDVLALDRQEDDLDRRDQASVAAIGPSIVVTMGLVVAIGACFLCL